VEEGYLRVLTEAGDLEEHCLCIPLRNSTL